MLLIVNEILIVAFGNSMWCQILVYVKPYISRDEEWRTADCTLLILAFTAGNTPCIAHLL